MVTADEVLALLAELRSEGAEVWVGGGWGIDALVGRQTRPHADLDLMHRREQEPGVLAALGAAGFAETLDHRPVRFVYAHADGRKADLRPLRFSADGSAVQESPGQGPPFHYPADCFVTGTVGGVRVPCLSAAQQTYFHQGYEYRDRDRHDMALLRGKLATGTWR